MHRAIIAIWVDDCDDSPEAYRFVRLFTAAADRVTRMFGKRISVAGYAEETRPGQAPAMTGGVVHQDTVPDMTGLTDVSN